MISSRLWLVRFLPVLWLGASAWAQQGAGAASGGAGGAAPSSPGATGTGGSVSSPFGPGSAAPSNPFGSPPGGGFGTPATPSAGSSATGFGTGIGSGTPAQTGQPSGTEIPGGSKPADSSPTSFSISTGYGRAAEVFVSGEGRLARPRFITKVSGSIGFDDNLFQTPTDAQGTPDTVVRQQISEGTAAQVVLVPVRDRTPQRIGIIAPQRKQKFQRVVIPGTEPQFQDIVIPGTPKPERKFSAISRETLSFEAQTATRRSVFTFDLNANADYYWNRPGSKKSEYNGSLAIRYLHRFTPRLQMTASVDVSYLSQPDLTQINTPTNTGNGNYLVTSGKVDLSYRWTPRFSTVSSVSYNRLDHEEKLRRVGDYASTTFGTELRYLWSPKLTAVLEGRVSQVSYPNNSPLDSSSYYGLVGVDLSLSRRASAVVRIGEVVRSFDQSGGDSSSPYLEATLNYQLGKASVLSWNNRFGFEEPPDPNTEVLSFRSGLSVTHFFTPRLRGSLSIFGSHRTSKNSLAGTDTTEDTLDSSLSFLYTLTRKWTFNLSYNYTTVFFDPVDSSNYFRDHVFAGFDYSF